MPCPCFALSRGLSASNWAGPALACLTIYILPYTARQGGAGAERKKKKKKKKETFCFHHLSLFYNGLPKFRSRKIPEQLRRGKKKKGMPGIARHGRSVQLKDMTSTFITDMGGKREKGGAQYNVVCRVTRRRSQKCWKRREKGPVGGTWVPQADKRRKRIANGRNRVCKNS